MTAPWNPRWLWLPRRTIGSENLAVAEAVAERRIPTKHNVDRSDLMFRRGTPVARIVVSATTGRRRRCTASTATTMPWATAATTTTDTRTTTTVTGAAGVATTTGAAAVATTTGAATVATTTAPLKKARVTGNYVLMEESTARTSGAISTTVWSAFTFVSSQLNYSLMRHPLCAQWVGEIPISSIISKVIALACVITAFWTWAIQRNHEDAIDRLSFTCCWIILLTYHSPAAELYF